MKQNLSLFDDFLEVSEATEKTLDNKNPLVAKRAVDMDVRNSEIIFSQDVSANTEITIKNTNTQEKMKKELEIFPSDEVLEDAKNYFNGDDLAANVWMNK